MDNQSVTNKALYDFVLLSSRQVLATSGALARAFEVEKYRAAWHKLGILEFTLETIACRVFESFQRNEISFDTMAAACDSIEQVERIHAAELGLE